MRAVRARDEGPARRGRPGTRPAVRSWSSSGSSSASTSRSPARSISPVGDIAVDSKGAWSSIVGTLGGIFGKSPHKLGAAQAHQMGLEQFQPAFAQGFSITANLCTSAIVFSLEKPPKGTMGPPEIGQTEEVAAELHANSVMTFGPFPAPRGMSIDAVVEGGSARLYLACLDQAEESRRRSSTTSSITPSRSPPRS